MSLQHLNLEAEDCRTLFGWNHYPDPKRQGLRSDQLRLLPHADTDVITLLFQRPGVGHHLHVSLAVELVCQTILICQQSVTGNVPSVAVGCRCCSHVTLQKKRVIDNQHLYFSILVLDCTWFSMNFIRASASLHLHNLLHSSSENVQGNQMLIS